MVVLSSTLTIMPQTPYWQDASKYLGSSSLLLAPWPRFKTRQLLYAVGGLGRCRLGKHEMPREQRSWF